LPATGHKKSDGVSRRQPVGCDRHTGRAVHRG
jgi:hypothetical protein